MDGGKIGSDIVSEASAALREVGISIEDVAVTAAGKRRMVRVTVARGLESLADDDHSSTVEPLSLDEVAAASRAVNDVLDGSDIMGAAAYTLEVSSAGVGQRLVTPDQFRRNVGRLLEVTLQGGGILTERVVSAGPEGLGLGTLERPLVPYTDISKAAVQVEFSRPTTGD